MELQQYLNGPKAANKTQLKKLAADLVASDSHSAAEIAALALRLETFAKELKAAAKNGNIKSDELAQLGGKVSETASYDYSNSEAWNYLQNELAAVCEPIKEQIKQVETLAKQLANSPAYANGKVAPQYFTSEHGELLEIKPAIKTSITKLELK